MDAIDIIVKRNEPIVDKSWFFANNNANLAIYLALYKVSDFYHIVSNRLGYVSIIDYEKGFRK